MACQNSEENYTLFTFSEYILYGLWIFAFSLTIIPKSGFEISDVLSINDKDYSITFGLYFSVEWVEPRLNLSQEVWGAGSGVGDTLVPGQQLHNVVREV